MARETGLEPATSTVTGWHSNQLSYAPASRYAITIHHRKENASAKTKKNAIFSVFSVFSVAESRFCGIFPEDKPHQTWINEHHEESI